MWHNTLGRRFCSHWRNNIIWWCQTEETEIWAQSGSSTPPRWWCWASHSRHRPPPECSSSGNEVEISYMLEWSAQPRWPTCSLGRLQCTPGHLRWVILHKAQHAVSPLTPACIWLVQHPGCTALAKLEEKVTWLSLCKVIFSRLITMFPHGNHHGIVLCC